MKLQPFFIIICNSHVHPMGLEPNISPHLEFIRVGEGDAN